MRTFFGPEAYGHAISAARVVTGDTERQDLGNGVAFMRATGRETIPARCRRCHAPLSDTQRMRSECPGHVVEVRVAATRLDVELEVGADARAAAELFNLDRPGDALIERALL